MACLVMVWTVPSAQAFWVVTRTMMEEEMITETDLIRTVDNFIILFDTSSSTNEMVPGKNVSKIQAVKNLLKERNAWFPELGYQAGLYIYTDHETLMGTFKEVYGMQTYDRERFGAAVDQLPEKGQGATYLQSGLSPLRKVLANLTGETAIIMFTDGKITRARGPKRPIQIAQEIARDHDVCFYLVSSATDDVEKQLVEGVSTVNACSRVVPLNQFLDNPHYLSGALFTIKTTAYARLKPVTKVVGFVAEDMLFDFDSPSIRDGYYEKLGLLGSYLRDNPDAYVVAGGYTDSVGDPEYNLALSERRVDSLKTHLVDQFNIDPERIVTLWFGEDFPVADNGTAQGRQLNRRVQIAVGGVD
jgi:OOP family OmpA-OmpF porin